MAQFVFENFVNTTLAEAASSTATTLTLSSATGLPSTLAQGQQIPLVLNSASNGSVFETCYITGINGATVTVLRAQEGTGAQQWNVGDFAYVAMTAGTTAPVIATHSPTASETLPVANQLVVTPGTLTAGIDLTLNDTAAAGSGVTIYGSAADYAVTVQSPVTTGSPYIELPDGSQVYSWVIPASSPGQSIKLEWDGTNWRAQTFGQTVVAPAAESNQAVQLKQLEDGSISPTFANESIAGTLSVSGDIETVSTGYNGTGLTVGWNFTDGEGEVDFLLGPQGGTGGLNIYQLNSNGDMVSTTPTLALSSGGNLTLSGDITTTGVTNSGNESIAGDLTVNGTTSLGRTIVAPATQSNEAVQLGQLNSLRGVYYDIAGGFSGLGSANNVLLDYVSVRAVTFGANFAGSLGIAGTAATADVVYTIEINGAAVGTMNFAAGAAAATFTSSGGAAVDLSAGQNLQVIGPATPDATLANLTFTLLGSAS